MQANRAFPQCVPYRPARRVGRHLTPLAALLALAFGSQAAPVGGQVAAGIARIFGKEWSSPGALNTLRRQNKPKGFMCVSCSWAKPADYHPFEFCENGAKATLWELTSRRCTPSHRLMA